MNLTFYEVFQDISIDNKYTRWYLQICERASYRAKTRNQAKREFGYVEQHHIVPKCFQIGDINNPKNLFS